MPKIKFSQKNIAGIQPPAHGQIVYRDSQTPYLAIIARQSGSKTFYYIRRIHGALLQIKIASCNEITCQQAQTIAQQKTLQLANPESVSLNHTEKLTLHFAFDQWQKNATARGDREKSIRDVLCRIAIHIPQSIMNSEINHIRKADIQSLYNHLAATISHTTARHIIVYIAAAINTLIKMEYPIQRNPAKNITMHPPVQRERFLQEDEIKRFFQAIHQSESQMFKDFVLVALFTSKRRANVESMRWEDIDFLHETWTIPKEKHKNRTTDIAVLDPVVLSILRRRLDEQREQQIHSPFVFHSPGSASGHYREPKTAWRNMLKRAQINDLRIHDLRRTLASYMANRNVSLHMIAGVLGQKSTLATPIYARLSIAAKKKAVAGAVCDILSAGKDAKTAQTTAQKNEPAIRRRFAELAYSLPLDQIHRLLATLEPENPLPAAAGR